MDNSPQQLAAAQRAADRLGIPCQFVLADLLKLPDDLLRAEFDLVFSAWVTAWIGNLSRWFSNVAQALKPGGVFLLSGGHPLTAFVAQQQQEERARSSYYQEGPFYEKADQSPKWNPAGDLYTTIEWQPTLSSIVTAVAQSGLRITHLFELSDAAAKYGLPGYPYEFLIRAVKE